MSLSGVWNLIKKTIPAIANNASEVMRQDKIWFARFFLHCMKQTLPGAYAIFIKAELNKVLQKNTISSIQNTTSTRVAVLSAGYYMSPVVLDSLKKTLEEKWIEVIVCDHRYISQSWIKKQIGILKSIVEKKKWENKKVVIFWYSSWGIIAHRVWAQFDIPSISFGSPEDSHQSLVGNMLEISMWVQPRVFSIPEKGVNLRESFSAMVPRTTHDKKNTIVLPGIYSHMSINVPDIIKEITTKIIEKLESQ
jgi:hypothetical protein